MTKRVTPAQAAALIPDGATLAISGGGYRAVAESVLKGWPRGLRRKGRRGT